MDPSRDDLGFKIKPCEREYCPGPMYCWDLHDGEVLPAPDPALFPMSPYDDRMWDTFQRGRIRSKRQHTTDGCAGGSRLPVPLLSSPPLSATALTTSSAWPAAQLPARPYHHSPPRPAGQHSAPHEEFAPRFASLFPPPGFERRYSSNTDHFPPGYTGPPYSHTGHFPPPDYPGASSSHTGYTPPGRMGPSSTGIGYTPPGHMGPSSSGTGFFFPQDYPGPSSSYTGYIPPGYMGPSSSHTSYVPRGYAGPSSSGTDPFHPGYAGPYSSDDKGSAFPPWGYSSSQTSYLRDRDYYKEGPSSSVTSSHLSPPGYLGRYSSGTGYFSPTYTNVRPPSGTIGYIRPSRLPGPSSLRHRVHSSPLPPTPATFLHQNTQAPIPPAPAATFPHQATGASLPPVPAATIVQLDSGAPLPPAPATSLQATQGTLPPVSRL